MSRYIDADALMERLKMHCYVVEYDHGYTSKDYGMTLTGINQVIHELPTIEAVPVRKGKWKSDEEEGDIMCSCCGDWWASGFETAFHYCPNCGASKMEGAEDV